MVAAGVAAALMVQPEAVQVQTSEGRPQPRFDHAVGYFDEQLRRVVLVGGEGQPRAGEHDRVWSWTGMRWEPVTESGPPSRVNAAAAYDSSRGKAIVVGGARLASGSTWDVIGDTWEGDRSGWRQTHDIDPRDHHTLVADERGTVLMFGGIPTARSGPWPADTWTLGPGGWARVASEGPIARARTALAYDRSRRQVVLFGGVSAPSVPGQQQTFLNDTWVWQGGTWRKAAGLGPRGRYAHAMVFDERAGVVLLYSGSAAHRDGPLTDMWQWDGTRWTEIPLTSPTPGHRYQPVMVYDRERGRTVLYGGLQGSRYETWEWAGKRWTAITP